MREILFRGRLHSGTWAFGNLDIGFRGVTVITPDETPLGSYGQVDPDTVGQYTGLVDKNGNKIFEGDIVKCRHVYEDWDETFDSCNIRRAYGKAVDDTTGECTYWRNYVVRMGDGRWVLRNGSDGHDVKQNYIHNHFVEVVGNIHDNTELLKE